MDENQLKVVKTYLKCTVDYSFSFIMLCSFSDTCIALKSLNNLLIFKQISAELKNMT